MRSLILKAALAGLGLSVTKTLAVPIARDCLPHELQAIWQQPHRLSNRPPKVAGVAVKNTAKGLRSRAWPL